MCVSGGLPTLLVIVHVEKNVVEREKAMEQG